MYNFLKCVREVKKNQTDENILQYYKDLLLGIGVYYSDFKVITYIIMIKIIIII